MFISLIVKPKSLRPTKPPSSTKSPTRGSTSKLWLQCNALFLLNLFWSFYSTSTNSDYHLQLSLNPTFCLLWTPPSAYSEPHLQLSLNTIFSSYWSPPSPQSEHHLLFNVQYEHNLQTSLWTPPADLPLSKHHLQITLSTTFSWLWAPASADSEHHRQTSLRAPPSDLTLNTTHTCQEARK